MTDRLDARLNALTTELASAAPMPPPMPSLDQRRANATVGIATAALAFAAVIIVTIAGYATWSNLDRSRTTVASQASVFEATGATPVAVVASDGVTLRGYLWGGGTHGVLIQPAYGSADTDLLALAVSAHEAGATVMVLDPRGQGASDGRSDSDRLVSDLEDAMGDLLTRGVDQVTVAGIRHTATAAIVLGADAPEGLSGVVAYFPFEQYQGIDAIGVADRIGVPLTIVGASQPSHLGPWASNLARKAGITAVLLPSLPPDEDFMSYYRADMVRVLQDAIG